MNLSTVDGEVAGSIDCDEKMWDGDADHQLRTKRLFLICEKNTIFVEWRFFFSKELSNKIQIANVSPVNTAPSSTRLRRQPRLKRRFQFTIFSNRILFLHPITQRHELFRVLFFLSSFKISWVVASLLILSYGQKKGQTYGRSHRQGQWEWGWWRCRALSAPSWRSSAAGWSCGAPGCRTHWVLLRTQNTEHRTQNTGVLLRILRIGLNQGKEKRLLAKILEKARKRLSRQNSSATGLSFGALGARTEAKWEQPVWALQNWIWNFTKKQLVFWGINEWCNKIIQSS